MLGLLALIIGVVGFVLALIPALGIALGLVAIVIGVISLRKRWARGLATAGVVIGAVAAMFSVVVFMLVTITPYMIEQEQQQIELQQP